MKKQRRKIPLAARKAEQALRIAVANVIEEHRRNGDPLVVWKNGKVVKIPAKRLPRTK
ncbi:MAG: hypothetical protein HY922_04620 [Elusimicrobia bacterium]|nr:hypothetical protein [Elusimicrobiota bacterium]